MLLEDPSSHIGALSAKFRERSPILLKSESFPSILAWCLRRHVYVGWRGRTLPSLRKQSGEGASQSRVNPNPIQILVPVELLYISKIREIRAGATWAPRRS